MKRIAIVSVAAVLVATLATSANALDTVRTADDTVSGTITSVTALEVVVERGSTSRKVPAGEIESISFDGEPNVLKTARVSVGAGRYEDALDAGCGEASHVVMCVNARFTDEQPPVVHELSQTNGGIQIDCERGQVSIVDSY